LVEAERVACEGVAEPDRDQSLFDHVEDIAGVEPLKDYDFGSRIPHAQLAGAVIAFRPVRGLTAETPVLQRTLCTPRTMDNNASKSFGNFKSTTHLCYGILVGVQPAQVYLLIKSKYFTIHPNFKRIKKTEYFGFIVR
jgi:hypothetical protein